MSNRLTPFLNLLALRNYAGFADLAAGSKDFSAAVSFVNERIAVKNNCAVECKSGFVPVFLRMFE